MEVGVLSDIHDALAHLQEALSRFRDRGVGTLFFLGDFCSPGRTRRGPHPLPVLRPYLVRTGDYDAVFNGHTHERHEERLGETLWVNPGEVLGWKGRPSCALWDTAPNRVEFLDLA